MYTVMTNNTNFFDGGFDTIAEARIALTRWLHYNPQVVCWADIGDYQYLAFFQHKNDVQRFEIMIAE